MPKAPWVVLLASLACGAEPESTAVADSASVSLAAPAAAAPPAPSALELEERWVRDALELKPAVPAAQEEQYAALRAKSVVELQRSRTETSAAIEDRSGRRGTATLTDLNPAIREWFLLRLEWRDGASETYHLENPNPLKQRLLLEAGYRYGLVLDTLTGREECDLWSEGAASPLAQSAKIDRPYAELCGSRIYLRNRTAGRKTTLEKATDFLRDRIIGGEKITVFVRDNFLKDSHLSTSELLATEAGARSRPRLASAPVPPAVEEEFRNRSVIPAGLGLLVDAENRRELQVGRWYAVRGIPEVYVSAIQPRLVSRELLRGLAKQLNPLDEVELAALVYLVAFDLDELDLGFAVGTDHPRLGWSDRIPDSVRIPSMPGPDGFDTDAPLVRTGMVSPEAATRIVATFTGGFKRTHGAFKYSELALRDRGTHYGFLEHGTLLSKLLPGLATVVVYRGELVELKTWSAADDEDLWRVKHARQNGLALVEPDPESGEPRPGAMVPRWAHGNWSGSQEQRLRTLRAGLCLQERDTGRFLIYGYFSGATPSAMATVFLAYGCDYALMLDMNALEHTYLALYRVRNGEFLTQHLIDEMVVLDKSEGGQDLPRFVGFADNRDFFYLTRRRDP